MAPNSSSEEKLLKLIRKQDKNKQQAKDEKENEQASEQVAAKKSSRFLPAVNNILLITMLVGSGYIYMKYFANESDLSVRDSIGIDDEEFEISADIMSDEQHEPLERYIENVEEKELFKSPWDKPKDVVEQIVVSPLEDLSKLFKIVGIVLDSDPKVIIEDLKLKQTIFLSIGERINDAELAEIKESSVIFKYKNQEIELTP